jgi:hypothetical protein
MRYRQATPSASKCLGAETSRLMKPIKLSVLIEALEFGSDDSDYDVRIDLKDGCVVCVDRSVLAALEEGDEESLKDLPEWQKHEVELARSMLGDSGERFVHGPSKFDFHEYRQMERFIQTVENADAAEQLWRAIKGKGAFRYFKDTAARLGLVDRWYRYLEDAKKEFVIDWAKAEEIAYKDDIQTKG